MKTNDKGVPIFFSIGYIMKILPRKLRALPD